AVLDDQLAVGRAHLAPPGAARADVHLAGKRPKALRCPPARSLPGICPGGIDLLARRGQLAGEKQFRQWLGHDVHGFLSYSLSITISMASPNSGGRPKSAGLMRPRAVTPSRGWPPKPLPATT